jgi:hypothetical protein
MGSRSYELYKGEVDTSNRIIMNHYQWSPAFTLGGKEGQETR